jgi:hypothetical protein
MLRSQRHQDDRRPAMILMVVLALLTLFATLGIAFVFTAQAQHEAAFHWRQARWFGFTAGTGTGGDELIEFALGQLLYGPPPNNYRSAMRGHSMAENMYGYNPATLNTIPHSGIPNVKGDNFLNFTHFPNDNVRYDPQRVGSEPAGPDGLPAGGTAPATAPSATPYVPDHTPHYTFPDHTTLFLGASAADGQLLMPSFHRPSIFGRWLGTPLTLPATPNPGGTDNRTNRLGKYLTLRPTNAEHPNFDLPADEGGDVKNRIGTPAITLPSGAVINNDSIWIDLGYPVKETTALGKHVPLFAFYIEDLDNRVNVNAHGNVQVDVGGGAFDHASNQGLGKWEVNLAHVLTGPEWNQLFRQPLTPPLGKYGSDAQPTASCSCPRSTGPRSSAAGSAPR